MSLNLLIIINFGLIINSIKGNIIKLHFYKEKKFYKNQIENIFFTAISTDISFGTPSFDISTEISTDTPYFIVKGSKSKNEYNQEKSSSFDFIKYGNSYEYNNIYFHAVFFHENFKIDNKIINLITMMNWSKKQVSNNYGLIGLQLYDNKFNEQNIFINQLYDKGLIKRKMFTLLYENEFKGELIIGDFPHYNYTNLLSDKKNFTIANNSFITFGKVWGTNFENIEYGQNGFFVRYLQIKENIKMAIISNTIKGIIGSNNFKKYVHELYFKRNIEDKSCWIETVNDDKYYGYICSNDTYISRIPTIKFYNKELNYIFEIENDELWINYGNLKYFMVFFSNSTQHYWMLGQKFLEKYPLVFDGENNLIGLYYTEKIKEDNSIKFIFLFLFIIFILIIIYLIHKCFNHPKKKVLDVSIELNNND